MRLRRGFFAAAAVAALSFAGCSGSDAPPTAPVSGSVTMDGQPVPDANVTFYPEKGRPASGRTGPDGRFELTTLKPGDGAALGTHKIAVTVAAPESSFDPINGPPQPGQPGYEAFMKSQKKRVDPRFADPEKSGLTMVVEGPADDVVLKVTPGK